jgi:hypothetical protein
MRHFALELDDRAVAIATDGQVLSSASSAVFDGTAGTIVGANAWRELRVRPRAISTRHLGVVLTQRGTSVRAETLLEAELNLRLAGRTEGQRLWIVSPAHAEGAGLTALLGITRRMGLPVDGFIDSATVTTAALGSEQNTIVLELGLHHAAATSVDCTGSQARRRRAVHFERGGIIELYQVWLDLVSTTMVKRTRFDPLHDAATEQLVFESIPALALEAANVGSATANITKGVDRFEVALTRDQFAQAAQPIYRAIISLLHQLRPAGVPVSVVMPQLTAQLPGLREQLEQFVGCELIAVPDGFAAAATSLLELAVPPADENAVVLLRRIPLMQRIDSVAETAGRSPTTSSSNAGDPHEASRVAGNTPTLAHEADGRTRSASEPARVVGSTPSLAHEANVRTHSASEPARVIGSTPSLAHEANVRTHSAAGPARVAAVAHADAHVVGISRSPLGQRRITGPAPSHVLWEGRAYPLQPDTLVVGREPTANPRHITLPDGLAGVSRRHCTFVHDGDELVLLDHSSFGTFVNGERVQERVRIYAGDRVKVGEPGIELTLIAVGPQQP